MICSRCLITHGTGAEKQEVHEATDRIHAWLKERMLLVMNAGPVKQGAVHIRPPRLEKVPLAQLPIIEEDQDA